MASRKRLYDSFRVRTSGMPWHARGAAVDFHLCGTVVARCVPRFNKNPSYHTVLAFTNRNFPVRGRIFWAFDLLPAAEGSSIDPTKTLNRGTTREPAPFQFRVCARHPDVERITESESADADLRLREWEY
jgi:hypothetical protein